MATKHTGAKYDSNRNLAETAKLVRADIKAAVASGLLPRATYAATIQRFSMGQSILVRISAPSFLTLNPERVRFEAAEPSGFPHFPVEDPRHHRHTRTARLVFHVLDRILNEYNRDPHSKHPHFFGHVNFASTVTDAERAAILALPASVKITPREFTPTFTAIAGTKGAAKWAVGVCTGADCGIPVVMLAAHGNASPRCLCGADIETVVGPLTQAECEAFVADIDSYNGARVVR